MTRLISIHIYTLTHTHTHTHTQTNTHAHTHMHAHAHTHTCLYTHFQTLKQDGATSNVFQSLAYLVCGLLAYMPANAA
jgi:uncharacterized paraquat-inducible protein A